MGAEKSVSSKKLIIMQVTEILLVGYPKHTFYAQNTLGQRGVQKHIFRQRMVKNKPSAKECPKTHLLPGGAPKHTFWQGVPQNTNSGRGCPKTHLLAGGAPKHKFQQRVHRNPPTGTECHKNTKKSHVGEWS